MMAGVATICEECEGKRFQASVLEYHLGGRDISEVLAMSVTEAEEFFGAGEARTPAAHAILDRLADVGLGYLSLGQPLTTLSGGERQRLKLATHLAEKGGVYVLDEPTTGLHLADVARLRRVRDRIDREYAQPLDVEALARGAHMSAGHLSREFRLAYGESPYSYVMTRRIERAMALLRRGDLSVTEVCFAVGCSSLGTFSTRFTDLVGMPPSTDRRHAARATAGMPPCVAKQVTRPIRNREAPVTQPHLA